ncbi:MAG: NifB/NifX family molybdenum-iron cluster-binding protein [Bacteroidales bacterium]|nr:NifB/NifX family molybdenum-iron cluster-binding protein [Bacteroidales bacterium]
MKIAFPASANKPEALIDERFARCPFFCFYDFGTQQIEFKENMLRNGAGGVGLQVAEFMANNGVDKVLAVEFGPKAKDTLTKLRIGTESITSGKTVQQIIDENRPA